MFSDETVSISKPYTDFRSEDEVSDPPDEHREPSSGRRPGNEPARTVGHTRQTVQVIVRENYRFSTSVALDLGRRLAPSPYIPIRSPSLDHVFNAFAGRCVAVPVSLEAVSIPFNPNRRGFRCLADLYRLYYRQSLLTMSRDYASPLPIITLSIRHEPCTSRRHNRLDPTLYRALTTSYHTLRPEQEPAKPTEPVTSSIEGFDCTA